LTGAEVPEIVPAFGSGTCRAAGPDGNCDDGAKTVVGGATAAPGRVPGWTAPPSVGKYAETVVQADNIAAHVNNDASPSQERKVQSS